MLLKVALSTIEQTNVTITIGRHSFLASDLPNLTANTPAVLECFQNDGPKGDRYVCLFDGA
jgi:hypothetical protein